ncbi:MAG: DUF3302 domain-containing protein [Hyphomicrobiales bacterium]
MSGLDIFALIVLVVLLLTGIGAWVLLGMAPGKIARSRNHPQADAISVCGWWGALTLGILSPLAFVWAYTKPAADAEQTSAEGDA